MAVSSSNLFLLLFLLSVSVALIPAPAVSQATCTGQKFKNNNIYAHCLDLPVLSSYLHFTYDTANATLSVAFIATPSKPDGWISWAINPVALKMAGSQALVAYKDAGSVAVVKTYNISSYSSVVRSPLSFEVWDTSAQADTSSGLITLFAKVKVPADLAAKGSFNQVWQVGPSVDSATGRLTAHDFAAANLASTGTLSLAGGVQTSSTGGGVGSRTKKKNIHGVLNSVSWGILFPLGVIIARYVKTFESAGDAWFYLHVACQIAGYAIGVAGWATGLKLGSESHGIVWHTHRNIGISLFALATLQIFALFLRPQKDHKFRLYWNLYHWSVGYTVIILGILNIFKGFDILHPEQKWKTAYIIAIIALGGISALLELITWVIVIRRKTNKSTKPYDGYNDRQQDRPGA